ncbi:cytochrome c biogenesis protein CcsA [Luteolibacter yonseiensis]|uniref:Cytochrome c biogenesis protein CcsA n=1 Tax=Luteolibacter yonseiensis TaxID=1144680 RepID=A0A934R770_9BACT|nr:cytochrome c biogenesis protein CcsA [Luteolibacter yonseiensis]MBK1818292.1 cytochrome c biogenesis protein CcsA [Luteolibacter yonseiensis]
MNLDTCAAGFVTPWMGMDRWFLIAATLLAAAGGIWGMISVHHGKRSHWTVVWMAATFLCQIGFLAVRGDMRAACPLMDRGEILSFLAWSLTLFYLLVGPTYRISLLGVFTSPVVVLFQTLALVPGMLATNPAKISGVNAWHETHSAMSVLAYGALALAAVAGVMFLVLDKQLKDHHLKSGLFRNLPPVRELLISLERLLWIGGGLLTVGIVAGFLMPHTASALPHLIAAVAIWTAYVVLLGLKKVRGLTGRRISLSAVVLFVLSLAVFAFI